MKKNNSKKIVEYLFTNDYEKAIIDQLLNLAISKDNKILNIACEHRLVPDFLNKIINPDRTFGLEINRIITETNPKIKYCNVNCDKFPFETESFDIIISIWGMEHFQTKNVFQESCRVLKKGGRFVFITPNTSNPIFFFNKIFNGQLSKIYYKYFTTSQYKPHITFYKFNNQKMLRKIAQIYGYSFKKIIYLGPSCFLDYFSFSCFLQNTIRKLEKVATNRFLYFLKPYFICILEK
ncbi:MAG: class I SAM-dependent methyltransferase [bacterium]|nr:class I SAM-dependent methyltransferase [bacterium]